MKKITLLTVSIMLMTASICLAGFFDNILKGIGVVSEEGMDHDTLVSGLKEALSVGTDNAVKQVSQFDGYMANEAIKILMPEKVQMAADVLGKVGYQKQVDDFITSMNRAAEKAAPRARTYFVDSIKEMTFDDAKRILDGGDTAATDYFRGKTSGKLYNEFKPIVSSSMGEAGVTRAYKQMMDKYTSLPFMNEVLFDLDDYVTNKSLEGLFYMIAQEEKKIRTDPAARVTELLKTVFTK